MNVLLLIGVLFVFSQNNAAPCSPASIEMQDNIEAVRTCVEEQELRSHFATIQIYLQLPLVPFDDEAYNRFFVCYWKYLGLLNEDDDINYDHLKAYLIKMLAKRSFINTAQINLAAQTAVDKCQNKTELCLLSRQHFDWKNPGERAVRTQSCIRVEFIDLGIDQV